MKIYTIKLSRTFMKRHPRAGEPTLFVEKFKLGQRMVDPQIVIDHGADLFPKLHTIRGNYELWAARIREVQVDRAVLRVQYWSDKPFRSKATTICDLTAANNIGCQKVTFDRDQLQSMRIDGFTAPRDLRIVAGNDGLSFEDFQAWFKDYNLSEPMALIQFTAFRY